MSRRAEALPFEDARQIVYLEPKLLHQCHMYMEANALPNASQTLAELVKLGLGASPTVAVVSGIKARVWRGINTRLRERISQVLREIATEFEQAGNDPASWEG